MELTSTEKGEHQCYYLSYHAVRNGNSITMKLRIAFDAKAKSDMGLNLNDVLLRGPCIQEELVTIMAISPFRTHRYVFTADIKKMYRQFWMNNDNRNYHRILWHEDPVQLIKTFRLKTVIYGVITASYLAKACLRELAENESTCYPEACQALIHDFYMDDFLGGTMTKTEVLKFRENLTTVLEMAGLELGKYSSNSPELIQSNRHEY